MNVADIQGNTPLHIAAMRGHHEIMNILLRNGADPLAPNARGETPFFLALSMGHNRAVNSLLRAAPQLANLTFSPARNTPLHYAAAQGDLALVRLLVSSGANINALNAQHKRPLDLAYEYKAFCTQKPRSSKTPSEIPLRKRPRNETTSACEKRYDAVIQYLQSKGAW